MLFLFHEIIDWFLDDIHVCEWKTFDTFVIFVQRWHFEFAHERISEFALTGLVTMPESTRAT